MKTMKISVARFLGIKEQSIEIYVDGGITKIVALNSKGKTSMATAVRAVATRMQCHSIKSWRGMIHSLSEDNNFSIKATANDAYWEADKDGATGRDEGNIPKSSSIACGLELVALAKNIDAVRIWQRIVGAGCLESALRERLIKFLDEKQTESVIGMVKASGWEKTEKVFSDNLRLNGRRWHDVTGAFFGLTKIKDWTPPGFTDDLRDADIAKLRAEVGSAERNLTKAEKEKYKALGAEKATARTRKQANELKVKTEERIKNKIEEVKEAEKKLAEHAEFFDAWEKGAEVAKQDLLKKIEMHACVIAVCPCCKKELKIHDGNLFIHLPVKEDNGVLIASIENKLKAIEGDREEKQKEIGVLEQALNAKKNILQVETAKLERSKETMENGKKRKDSLVLRDDVERCTGIAETARKRLSDYERFHKSSVHAQNALKDSAIKEVLGPTGIRKELTDGKISLISQFLDKFGVGVGIDRNKYLITFNGRPTSFDYGVSESEKWRGQAYAQIAIASQEGDELVVLDGVDILDKPNRDVLNDIIRRAIAFRREKMTKDTNLRPLSFVLFETG